MRKGSWLFMAVVASVARAVGLAAAPADRLDSLFAPDQAAARAALLIVDGKVIGKRYAPGYSDANRFISWSMAKTITGMMVGELVADGRLALDAPAPVAEWQAPGDPRRAITLRQMLGMASGLRHTEVGDPIENSDTNQAEFVSGTGAMAAYGIAQPLEATPGTKFEYSTLTSIILAEIVTRTLTPSRDPQTRARAYRDFAQARIFGPAGVTSAFMEFDGAGTQVGGSLIHMTLDDWGRMGGVLLDGKGADGGVIVAPEWLAFMKAPTRLNPEYGAQTWLNNRPIGGREPALFPGQGPSTAAAMNGHLGQLVIAAEAKGHRMVLVRLGNTPDSRNRTLMDALGAIVARVLPKG